MNTLTSKFWHKYSFVTMLFAILIVFLILTSGCVTLKRCNEKYPPQISTKDSIIRTVQYLKKDSTIWIPPDSAWYYAMIQCQQNAQGKWEPVIEDQKTKGKIHLAGVMASGQLTVTATIDSQAVYLSWKEKYEKTKETVTITKSYPVNTLTWLQKILIPCGWVFFGLVIAGLGYLGLKLSKIV